MAKSDGGASIERMIRVAGERRASGDMLIGEEVILVDEDDRAVGKAPKLDSHLGEGLLHRAFSVFLFNRSGELLLQERSACKLLWPAHWSNSCCSHPRPGEAVVAAASRRIGEELGVSCTPRFFYKFLYEASFGSIGIEREVCHVLGAVVDDEVVPDPDEVANLRYIGSRALDAEMADRPEAFTPWFRLEWPRVRDEFVSALLSGSH